MSKNSKFWKYISTQVLLISKFEVADSTQGISFVMKLESDFNTYLSNWTFYLNLLEYYVTFGSEVTKLENIFTKDLLISEFNVTDSTLASTFRQKWFLQQTY